MARSVELIRVGDSLGVVLPRELLDRLHVSPGDLLDLVETPRGVELTPHDPEVEEQIDTAEAVMREDREVLRKLGE